MFVCLFICLFYYYYYFLYYKTPLWICSFSYSFYVRFLFLCYFQNSPMALSMLICSNKIGVFFWKKIFRCYMNARSCMHMICVCENMRVHICIHLVSPRFIQHTHTHTHTRQRAGNGTHVSLQSLFFFFFLRQRARNGTHVSLQICAKTEFSNGRGGIFQPPGYCI